MLEEHQDISRMAITASTDLLHRRLPLPYSLQLEIRESVVCIRTNSPLMTGAILGLKLPTIPNDQESNAEWEIAVETQDRQKATQLIDRRKLEFYGFGSSRALRTEDGSWFAHTPPSLNGVGFAMITGTASEQMDQLSVYVCAIAHFLDNTAR